MSSCPPERDGAACFMQVGYVCRNLEQGMLTLAGAGAESSFLIIDVAQSMGVSDAPVRRIGLTYANDINLEILEVAKDCGPFFSEALPVDDGAGFHHLGYLVSDPLAWDELKRTIEKAGGAAMEGEIPGALRYIYVDRRGDLGHYIEYIFLDEGGKALFSNVPRKRLRLAAA
jgi:hypothetical protein